MRLASLAASLLALALLPSPATADRDATQSATSAQLVFATATDLRKAPVTDLRATEFVVKEDGKECAVIAVERATAEMQVAILVDDNGTGIFHFGLNGLGELLQGRAQIALSVITNQVQKVFDYTTDAKTWSAGFARTGVRPSTPEGGQLLEGVFSSATELKRREARRPVIIVLTVGGEEQSPLPSRQVLDELRRSRASLHVLFVNSPAVRPVKPAGTPADLLEGNFNLSRVLGDGPKESGGANREVLAMKALSVEVQQIARDLLNQYVVTYTRTETRNPPQRLQVSVLRSGVTIIAPTRAPIG
jgi:hypothetical protein